jgi:hypothetical protein
MPWTCLPNFHAGTAWRVGIATGKLAGSGIKDLQSLARPGSWGGLAQGFIPSAHPDGSKKEATLAQVLTSRTVSSATQALILETQAPICSWARRLFCEALPYRLDRDQEFAAAYKLPAGVLVGFTVGGETVEKQSLCALV